MTRTYEEISKSNSVEDALSILTELLREREKDLEVREEKLREAQEAFEKERHDVYGDTSPNDVLHLNVGGKTTVILRRTLTSIPGSMLASRFSGRWDDSIEKDKDGNFFIDQPFDLFEPMIDYLRNQSNGTKIYPLKSPNFTDGTMKQNFYRMVDYYGMTHGIYPTRLKLRFGSQDDVEEETPWKVNAKEWTTFKLVRGHYREVKTYEVMLGSVQRIQIGWEYTKDVGANFSTGNKLGVGDVAKTSAIDLSRSGYLNDGKGVAIQNLERGAGTVVRSEDFGKNWYVNGKLVATESETREDGVVQSHGLEKSYGRERSSYGTKCSYFWPVISVEGEFEITGVEFMD